MAVSTGGGAWSPVIVGVLFLRVLFAAFPAASGGRVDVGDMLMMDRFLQWQAAHGRSYASAEERLRRFEVYRANVDYIDAANARGDLTYELGENEFADLTNEEFLAKYASSYEPDEDRLGGSANNASAYGVVDYNDESLEAPASWDWRAKGAVVTPKSQGSTCSSCWAFVTAATIESLHKIKTGSLVSLSEQQLVDCDRYDGGCNRGSYGRAYKWVTERGGLASEAEYPYTGRNGACRSARIVAKIRGSGTVSPRNEAAMQRAVAGQPVGVAIEVGSGMQFYRGGVYSGPCGTRLAHAVTVVGYGADAAGVPYWIIKNSWGPNWGERGFIRMRRNVGGPGLCGITLDVAYPY